jgi:gluconolactonase
VRTEDDGSMTVLADTHAGGRLNSPNDVAVKSDGTIWFTDPDYAIIESDGGAETAKEQDGNFVYRLDPESGDLEVVVDDFDKPNGLAFSPDESLLYVVDSARTHGEDRPHHLRVFDVVDGRRLENGRVFTVIEPYIPDGLRVAPSGDVFTSAGDGVQVFTPGGQLIGTFITPEVAANLCFGGPDGDTLFICATSSVWAIRIRL